MGRGGAWLFDSEEQRYSGGAERGLPCKVEPRAGLAVLIADRGTMTALADPEVRRATLALAREHGFTHVAVELRDDVAN